MYLHDPFDKIFPPSLEQSEINFEEEPRDYHEFFWDEFTEQGRHVGMSQKLYTQVCRLDQEGSHVTMARNCPHFDAGDEEGKIVRRGWTAQQGTGVR